MSAAVTLVTLQPRPALVMRATVAAGEIAAKLAEILPQVRKFAQSKGATPAGPPFAYYLAWNTDGTTDLEAGFPLTSAVAGEDPIEAVTLPGGEAAMLVHTGSHDKLGDVHAELGAWVRANRRQTAGPVWESYVTDPGANPDPAAWTTEVYWPVK